MNVFVFSFRALFNSKYLLMSLLILEYLYLSWTQLYLSMRLSLHLSHFKYFTWLRTNHDSLMFGKLRHLPTQDGCLGYPERAGKEIDRDSKSFMDYFDGQSLTDAVGFLPLHPASLTMTDRSVVNVFVRESDRESGERKCWVNQYETHNSTSQGIVHRKF